MVDESGGVDGDFGLDLGIGLISVGTVDKLELVDAVAVVKVPVVLARSFLLILEIPNPAKPSWIDTMSNFC